VAVPEAALTQVVDILTSGAPGQGPHARFHRRAAQLSPRSGEGDVRGGRPGGEPGEPGGLALPIDHTVADLDGLARTASVEAFTEIMRRRWPGFELDARNHADVADICVCVGGRPSHLELAARIVADGEGLHTVAEALRRGDWGHGLAALVEKHAGRVGPAGRDPRAALVLATASLCPDGLGVEAMRAITGLPDVSEPLGRLTDDGLLEASEARSGTLSSPVTRRYRLPLPAITAAPRGRADSGVLRDAHGDYFLRLAEVHAGEVWTQRQPAALLSLRQERRNITAALHWAVANGRESRAVALITALAPYWRRLAELHTLRSWVVELISRQPSLPVADAHRVNVLAADVFARLGEHEAALDAITAAADIAAASRIGEAAAADQLFATGLALHSTSSVRAAEHLRRAAERYREIGDEEGAAAAEFELSGAQFRLGRPRDAERTARSALSGAVRRGDELTSAALLLRLSAFAAAGEDPRASAAYVERAMIKLYGLGAAAAVGVLACQVDTQLEPSVVRRATNLARLLGSFSAYHRADFHDPSPDLVVGHRERRLLDQLGERALLEAATNGAGVPLPELLAEIAAGTFGPAAGSPAPLPRPSLLTPRETEVALLVCEGLTNKEVARRLAISEWTVVNHMRQIMRKLSCTSRVQVARWVIAAL
jgi:DNA-binding CsgD family transcriptional regulator/tetratricopeptide (TPR) repeat protein